MIAFIEYNRLRKRHGLPQVTQAQYIVEMARLRAQKQPETIETTYRVLDEDERQPNLIEYKPENPDSEVYSQYDASGHLSQELL